MNTLLGLTIITALAVAYMIRMGVLARRRKAATRRALLQEIAERARHSALSAAGCTAGELTSAMTETSLR